MDSDLKPSWKQRRFHTLMEPKHPDIPALVKLILRILIMKACAVICI